LDCEYFSVAGFCVIQIAREGVYVAQIAERIGECPRVIGQAIIRDGPFIRAFGLRQLASVEKNSCSMFVGVRHGVVKRVIRLISVKQDTNDVSRDACSASLLP
jgi:hypothetical protein